MEQLPDIFPSPEQLAAREQHFVAETLDRAGKVLAKRLDTKVKRIAQNYSGLEIMAKRPLYDADCRYSMKLDIEARASEADEYSGDTANTLLYRLERKMQQGLLFTELDATSQTALMQALLAEDDTDIRSSDAYQAMLATIAGQPSYPVYCDRMAKDTFSCSQYDASLVIKQSVERYTVRDDNGFYAQRLLVNTTDAYDGKGPQGVNWLRSVSVDWGDEPSDVSYMASTDDLAVMSEVLYYLNLPGGVIEEDIYEDYIGDSAVEALERDVVVDLDPWRRLYIKLHQPILDGLNDLYAAADNEVLTDDQQASMQAGVDELRTAMKANEVMDGFDLQRGDLVGVAGDQILQYYDESELMSTAAVHDGTIFGLFERVDVEMQLDEAYLQFDPATIMDEELEELRTPFGLHIVLSDVKVLNYLDEIIDYGDREMYLPLQCSRSKMVMYDTSNRLNDTTQ